MGEQQELEQDQDQGSHHETDDHIQPEDKQRRVSSDDSMVAELLHGHFTGRPSSEYGRPSSEYDEYDDDTGMVADVMKGVAFTSGSSGCRPKTIRAVAALPFVSQQSF